MVGAALEALVGGEPADEAIGAALSTIPGAELPDALRLLAREHGPAALPILRRCLRGRPEWATAAAVAIGTLAVLEAAEVLRAAEATAPSKTVRTAVRRALYRLRQAGIRPAEPPTPPRPAPAPPRASQAWMSAVDGTGSRGVWLMLEGPLGERTLLTAVLSDVAGVLDFASGPIPKKRLDERLRALRAESPLPWVAVPPSWAVAQLAEAARRHLGTDPPLPGELTRSLRTLAPPDEPGSPPIYDRLPETAVAADPTLLDRSAELLALPELAGWFLDPSTVQTDALDLLQVKESRLVVSDRIKAERVAALVDRVIDAHFTAEARRRWQRRLEETGFVLAETGRLAKAGWAVAAAGALADAERAARHIPFVRALVERSLEVAGEVALGRLAGDEVSRQPRRPGSPPPR